MELITPEEGSDIALYGKMAKWQFGLQPTLNSRDVLEVVGDTSRPLALRAEAIRILSSLKMTPGEARDVRGQLKVLVNNSDLPELNAAALVGLARVGDPEDMQIIINATRSSDSQIAQAATEAIASASEPEALGILTTLSQTHADERVRAAAVHGLESRDLAASVDDLVTIVQTDASPLVRREAVQALGEMEIPRELKADVDAALETAKADVSPEVRLEAERVLVRPRQ
jgi:HEAT repeat protein